MDDVVRLVLNPLDTAGKQRAELIGGSAVTFPIGLSIGNVIADLPMSSAHCLPAVSSGFRTRRTISSIAASVGGGKCAIASPGITPTLPRFAFSYGGLI